METFSVARASEVARKTKEWQNYSMTNCIWSSLMLIAIVMIFTSVTRSWKGVTLEILVLTTGGFPVDNFLHERAKVHLHVRHDAP